MFKLSPITTEAGAYDRLGSIESVPALPVEAM